MQSKIMVSLLRGLDRRHRRVVGRNLHLAFPDKSEAKRKKLEIAVYRHFFGVIQELSPLLAGKDPDSFLSRIVTTGMEHVEKALQKGKGVLLASAHFGNWECIPLVFSRQLGRKVFSIARPLDNPRLEGKLCRFRERAGSQVIYKKRSLRRILELLRANEIVAILIDQHAVAREGTLIDFFGHQTYANTTIAQIHLKLDIPVVPLLVHYENNRILIEIEPELSYLKKNELDEDIRGVTQSLYNLIEEKIRRFPEQWLWFHDRWKESKRGDLHA